MSDWKFQEVRAVADFNPSQYLPLNKLAKKIPMANLSPFQRKITGFEYAEYKSGPKFINGDTLVAKITPCLENGKTAFVDILDNKEVGFGSSEFIVLRAKSNSDSLYLYYLSRSPAFRKKAISCMEGTSGRKRVNEGTLKLQELLIPEKFTQQRIAAVLSSLDAKIELNNRINAQLEQMAKTLYDYWFVQFDFPNKDGKPYKSSGGKMVYNEVLKREIPEGWKVSTIVTLIESDKSGDWGKEEAQGNYTKRVLCIRGADINGINGKGELACPVRFILEKNSNKVLKPFDIVIEISGGSPTQSTGRMAFITKRTIIRFNESLICSNFCKAISLKNNNYFYYFTYLWNSIYDENILFGWEGKTSGIKNLLFDAFVQNHKVVIPKEDVAEKFFDFIEKIQDKKQKNLSENQQLTQLRDWLLPMLMNGQVRVS